jgi:DNA-directed RNA polymerase sigma subunit (sigma70/sigma32)
MDMRMAEAKLTFWTRDVFMFVLAMVSNREREVLRMRYGLDGFPPCSWVEVAEAFQISTDEATAVEQRAVQRACASLL